MREHNRIFKMITLITQIGITMLSSIFLSGAVGYLIDKHFHTHTFIVFLVIGIIGGYKGVYKLIRQFIDTDEKNDQSTFTPNDPWKDEEEDDPDL